MLDTGDSESGNKYLVCWIIYRYYSLVIEDGLLKCFLFLSNRVFIGIKCSMYLLKLFIKIAPLVVSDICYLKPNLSAYIYLKRKASPGLLF